MTQCHRQSLSDVGEHTLGVLTYPQPARAEGCVCQVTRFGHLEKAQCDAVTNQTTESAADSD